MLGNGKTAAGSKGDVTSKSSCTAQENAAAGKKASSELAKSSEGKHSPDSLVVMQPSFHFT